MWDETLYVWFLYIPFWVPHEFKQLFTGHEPNYRASTRPIGDRVYRSGNSLRGVNNLGCATPSPKSAPSGDVYARPGTCAAVDVDLYCGHTGLENQGGVFAAGPCGGAGDFCGSGFTVGTANVETTRGGAEIKSKCISSEIHTRLSPLNHGAPPRLEPPRPSGWPHFHPKIWRDTPSHVACT